MCVCVCVCVTLGVSGGVGVCGCHSGCVWGCVGGPSDIQSRYILFLQFLVFLSRVIQQSLWELLSRCWGGLIAA